MSVAQWASRFPALPGLRWLSPPAPQRLEAADLAGFAKTQSLALQAAKEIAGLIQEGWTESHTADLLNTYLLDSGVRSFFHKAFVWFGERTRFNGIRTYRDFSPTDRLVRAGEPFILDVAPVLDGYPCDIGWSGCLGENPDFNAAQSVLSELKTLIPSLFSKGHSADRICQTLEDWISQAGFQSIHLLYPFSVLGHRMHPTRIQSSFTYLGFGMSSYWPFLSRGLFGQLLNANYRGNLDGLWAIEPHLGGCGFGAKFEEILVVQGGQAHWLGALP